MQPNGISVPPRPVAELGTIDSPDRLAAAFLAGYGQTTRRAYARDLRTWGDYLATLGVEVLDARRLHVDPYCRAVEEMGSSPATLARRLAALSGFYAYAVDEVTRCVRRHESRTSRRVSAWIVCR